MKISIEEIEKEKKYLETVKDVTKLLIDEKNKIINSKKNTIVESKKNLWQNLNEYTLDHLVERTMKEEDLTVSILNNEIVKVAKLSRSLENPYFGRVDFQDKDGSESIYVGITGIEKDYKNYVYDWRAPISNLYYNFGVGKAFYETPTGKVDGEISLKRQFKIIMGELKDAFNSDITLEDELLQEVLLSSNDDKMKNIVSTIQKEQNEVIRFMNKKDLIIEGVAGSGKTSVALHRIAYLLYNQKDLTNKNVLIFSPNDVFTNYISNVLPELGEENVESITKEKLTKQFIPDMNVETLSKFIERFYNNDIKLDKNILSKFDKSYIGKLDKYVKEYTDSLTFSKKIGFKTKIVESAELNKIFKESARRLTLNDRIDYMAEKLCDKFKIDNKRNAPKMAEVLKGMLDIDDAITAYRKFLGNDAFASDGIIPYEDLSGILYLYFEIHGYPDYSYIKHIIIDEAQDYTILDFKLLKKIFNGALFTVLGDKNQAVNPYFKYDSLEELTEIFTNGKYEKLMKTYRSSAEIIEYTNKILGINNVKSVRVPMNREVIERHSNNIDDILSDINNLKKNFKRLAIITKTLDETTRLYEKLKSDEIGLITDSILKRVVIVPSYLSKGLEFEGVILYTDQNDKYNENEQNLFYVAATRAQHALIVYNQN